jgi:dTDP-4-dehydrorhamnose reductase
MPTHPECSLRKQRRLADSAAPINVDGKTKLAGERAVRAAGVPHMIFRTAWVYRLLLHARPFQPFLNPTSFKRLESGCLTGGRIAPCF